MTSLLQDCEWRSQSHNRSEDFKRQVARAYVDSNDSQHAVGVRFGVSATSVAYWANRYYPEEHDARRARVGANVPRKKTPELLGKAVDLLRSGMSVNETSRRIGIAGQTLTDWLRASGYESLIPPPRRRYIDVEVKRHAVREYLAGTSSAKVGKAYGVSAHSVERWVLQSLAGEL